MATKIRAKALQTLNWDYKKEEKNNRTTTIINEKPYACVSVNKTSKATDFEFKEDSFALDILNGTGYIASNGDKWLLLTLDKENAKELIDLSIKNWTDGKWAVNTEKTDEMLTAWKEQGCLTALRCNGFVQLELMAEVLKGISFEYRDCPVNLALTSEDLGTEAKASFEWYINTQIETGDEVTVSRTEKDKGKIKKFKTIKDNGLQCTLNLSDPTDWVDFLLPFEFTQTEEGEANYPYLKVEWTPPVIEEYKSGGKGGYGGNSVQVTETTPKDRLSFVYEFTGTNTPEGLVNADTKLVCTALLLSGAVLTDAYVSLLSNELYVPKTQKSSVSKEDVSSPNSVQEASQPKNGTVDYNGKGEAKIEGTDYTHLIGEWATNNPNKLPPELDLTDKSESWKRLYYALLTGTIGQKPMVGTTGRVNVVKIKKEYGAAMHELSEEQLAQLVERLDVINIESNDLVDLPY